MGTRAITNVFENQQPLVSLYVHSDGYPSGHGLALAEFLSTQRLVTGLGPADTQRSCNGAGCLAAQLIASLKTCPGHIYVRAYDAAATEEFRYDIRVETWVGLEAPTLRVQVFSRKPEMLFSGGVEEFLKWCKSEA